jgi:hypothetical protein
MSIHEETRLTAPRSMGGTLRCGPKGAERHA